MLKSHVSAPFFATIQCFTQKQVDNNIYIHKTHTFFFLGWVEIYIYIHQIPTIYLYPSTSSKFSNGTSSRPNCATGTPHWGWRPMLRGMCCVCGRLSEPVPRPARERTRDGLGVGKNHHSQLPPKKRAKKGHLFFFCWNYVTGG